MAIVLLAAMPAMVMGCASSPAEPARGESGLSNVPSSGLGPQKLDPGECGLFLWSKTDTSRFIFFSKALSGTALFKQEDEQLTLRQTRATGRIFGQFNTDITYQDQNGSSIHLVYSSGDMLTNGQRIKDGLITVTDTTGWRTKLPVLGVRACQPE
ncbi:MAG: hypothetical protein AAF613_05510 [Pseudomonadota bacterium]